MSDFIELASQISAETYQSFKLAVELGKWPDGRKLTQEQKELCLQAMIAWEVQHLPEEERTGYFDGQCASKGKKEPVATASDLFAPAAGTRH